MAAKEPFENSRRHAQGLPAFRALAKRTQGSLADPEALWPAAEAAREHGVFRAAKALHLEYGKLKRMLEARPRRRRGRRWRLQHFSN